jgi:hypothetical protein
MATGEPAPGFTKEQLKGALKAFKKRLKLTQLDDDSKISGGPLSKGKGAEILGMTPPSQFPPAIWDELVKQGKLRDAGGGMYELVVE